MNNKQESSQVRKALERARNYTVSQTAIHPNNSSLSIQNVIDRIDSELSRIEEEEIDPANKFDFKCVHGYKCKGNKVCEHCGGDRT